MDEKIKATISDINEMGYKSITLSENQTAKIIGVSASTLSIWRKEGIGPEFKKMNTGRNGRVFYTKNSIAEWINETSQNN